MTRSDNVQQEVVSLQVPDDLSILQPVMKRESENPFTFVSLRGLHGLIRKPPGCAHSKQRPQEGARNRGAHRYELQLLLAARRPGCRRSSFLTNVVRSLSRKSHLPSGDGVIDRGVVSECEEDDDVRVRDFPDSCVTVLNTASRASRATITAGSVHGL
ncbi:hypothetical protein MTO96_051287 [Rhipicephalus appendiculatus]